LTSRLYHKAWKPGRGGRDGAPATPSGRRYTRVLEVRASTIAEQLNRVNITLEDVGDGQ
jgi:hypothetical protein